jgi:hypothetical protein
MVNLKKVRELILGAPLDPMDARIRHAIAVTPLLAWVGLGVTAGGIIVLYVLWDAKAVEGQTPNAVVFRSIISLLGWGHHSCRMHFLRSSWHLRRVCFWSARRLVFWMGRQCSPTWLPTIGCRALSARLVRQNGVIVMAVSSMGILLWTQGPNQPTAVVLVGRHRGVSMHALIWVQRLFPHYKNFIFLAVGEVDAQSYEGQQHLRSLQNTIDASLRYYIRYCHNQGYPAESRIAFGTDPGAEFIKLAEKTMNDYPNSVCFASKLILSRANFLTAWLHNETPLFIQRRLHIRGKQMVLLPMRVG